MSEEEDYARCPKCGTRKMDLDFWFLVRHESLNLRCGFCGYRFVIGVEISVIFTNPPMLTEEEKEKL